MRTLTYGGAVSLDGFLAGVNGSIDWLHFSKDVNRVMTDYLKNVDTILMGRKTYAVSVAENPKRGKRTEPAMRTYVFSRTLKNIDEPGIHPILLGAAIPTFRDCGHRIKLTLTECRTLEGGCILANYQVLRAL